MRLKASSMSLHDYLDSFHSAISKIEDFGFSESIDIKVEIRPSKQAACKVKIVLIDGSVLQIREYIDAKYKPEKLNYAYHYTKVIKKQSLSKDAAFSIELQPTNSANRPVLSQGFKANL